MSTPDRGSSQNTGPLSREVRSDARILGRLVVLLWGLEALDQLLLGGGLDSLGIIPRSISGLWRILAAPLLHGGFGHLLSNTFPFLLLGWLTMSRKRMDFYVVTLVSTITAGLGAWLFGLPGTVHVGVSGVVFGYLGFLLGRGWFERRRKAVVLSVGVAFLFGGMLWGLIPFLQTGVSWESHLFGFVGGVLCARTLGQAIRRPG